jgi:anaerobic selenocysteine-containing dehydrogenase
MGAMLRCGIAGVSSGTRMAASGARRRATAAGGGATVGTKRLCHSFEMSTTVIRAACPHDCPDTCAMLVTVEDGRAIKVQGDPDHPPTHGALCTKVSRYPERTYHAERVLHPLKRVGPKGSGRFERVSWDAALDDIAARLKTIAGPDGANAEAILPYSYAAPWAWCRARVSRLGSSIGSAPRCSTARSARRPAARRSPRPTAPRSACTSSTSPRAG